MDEVTTRHPLKSWIMLFKNGTQMEVSRDRIKKTSFAHGLSALLISIIVPQTYHLPNELVETHGTYVLYHF